MQELRHEYRCWLDKIDIHNLVFLDQSGVNLKLTRTHGRAAVGEPVVDRVPRNWGQNVSILGALSTDGMIAAMTMSGSVDAPVFRTYITQVLVPQLWQGAIVLCDNLQVHKVAGIREAWSQIGVSTTLLARLVAD